MKYIIKLEKQDILTTFIGENVMVQPSDDFAIILDQDAAEELRDDLTVALAELARRGKMSPPGDDSS